MFLKPFKVKSKSVLKGSDRKRLKSMVLTQLPTITENDLNQMMKAKEAISQMKVMTQKGIQLIVYFFDKNPAFIEIEQSMLPTVYTLWKKPDIVPAFTTWPNVFDRLASGADLMLPGVVLREEDTSCEKLHSIKINDACSIKLAGNLTPIAVCRSLLPGRDIFVEGKRGKAAELIHMYGDLLWEQGDKSSPPEVPEVILEVPEELVTENENTENEEAADAVDELESEMPKLAVNDNLEAGVAEVVPVDDPVENVPSNDSVEPVKSLSEEMDELLWKCLLLSLKTNAKKLELPCLTSTFYRKHVLASCPQSKSIDIKKTSFKKLSNFLRAAEKEGILEVKELSEGVESVVNINFAHERLKRFEIRPEDLEETAPTNASENVEEFTSPPTLRELFVVSHAVAPFFDALHIKKGTPLSAKDVRNVLTEYVKQNELCKTDNKRLVTLDPVLCQCLAGKENIDALSWEELHQRCLSKMQPAHEITFPGKPPIVKKGPIESIDITVAQRAANKKVTLITHLDKYGIDPNRFAHELQTGVAASTSVAMNAEKKSLQVLVQGNQVKYVAKLLLDRYHIPKKYVKGLENAPKKK